jgi:hypothetical protein
MSLIRVIVGIQTIVYIIQSVLLYRKVLEIESIGRGWKRPIRDKDSSL